MKRQYQAPCLFVQHVQAEQMIAASVTVTISNDTYDGDAGVRDSNPFGETIFDE